MQLSQVLSLAALASAVSAVTVSFDNGYDDRERSLAQTSCSDGANGLMTRKPWRKLGDIPTFPFVGGAQAVAGWNSPSCGTCWRLDYHGQSINVLAIDHAAAGFNIAQGAMDRLTNNRAAQLGRVEATATQIDARMCGM